MLVQGKQVFFGCSRVTFSTCYVVCNFVASIQVLVTDKLGECSVIIITEGYIKALAKIWRIHCGVSLL